MTYIEAFEKMHERFGQSFCASLAYFTLEKYDLYNPHYLSVKKVIFNDPATIILWNDGTKTVVKCQPGDTYDKEKGFILAYLKKALGNDNTFNKEIHKWCPPDAADNEEKCCDSCKYDYDHLCKKMDCKECKMRDRGIIDCICEKYNFDGGKNCPHWEAYKE